MNPFEHVLSTTIDICASPRVVWEVLVDFGRYPEWTRIFEFPRGHTDVGKKLKVRISSGNRKSMIFEPLLLEAREPAEFRWRGRLLLRGIFDGEHIFRIEDAVEERTRFTHAEIFRGLLVPWLRRDLDKNTRRGFERFNMDIKERTEGMSRSGRSG
jgi:hypothetical protein